MPQRRAEVVRDGVGERLELFVGRHELIAALAQLGDELLLSLAHRRVVELHRRFAAADSQQRKVV